MVDSGKNSIFFDGVCGLCNRFIDFVIERDSKRNFYYAPLQGTIAQKHLTPELALKPESVVYLSSDGKLYLKSSAVLKLLRKIGGSWAVLATLATIFPTFLSDCIYDLVAQNRYRIFGKRDTCRLPTAKEKAFFLD